ncbi:unnamed protein product [Chironomus riparius]|uniref:palmitoyl-protein hydrolase n=1 Tax=Chironomus riparius TaxID=315576 RepID=A0A9N9WL30_9DIPT|nr:unnamed protein product [Chironomus riparius]
MRLIEKIIQPSSTHSATVIFFHGSGDTGSNLIEWIKFLLGRNFDLPHVKFIFPTAPVQRYTPLNGEYSNVWFDRKEIAIDVLECRKSLSAIYETVNELLNREIYGCSIPANRVVVGGFSMGGTLSLHTGFHLNRNLGGVFSLSSFLNDRSIVYESLENSSAQPLPPLKMFHGQRDTLVPINWAEKTFEELTKRGIKGDLITIRNAFHELKKNELLDLEKWIYEILPPLDNEFQNKL